jgi:hypothetical protein
MPRWTPAAREKQRLIINRTQPWLTSTGPKTSRGKFEAARNGPNHPPRESGTHPTEIRRQLVLWRKMLILHIRCMACPDLLRDVALLIFKLETQLGGDPELVCDRILEKLRRRR